MAAIAVDSPGACLIPPSFDGMTVQGPMTWEPYGFPRLPIDDMRHATGGGGSDEMSRVMCVLAGMERQLHSVLQGQAELRGLVAAASHRSPVQSPQTEQAVLPVAFPIDLGKESSPVGLDRLRSMSTESCQSGESTQPRKKHRYGAGSIWNSSQAYLPSRSSLHQCLRVAHRRLHRFVHSGEVNWSWDCSPSRSFACLSFSTLSSLASAWIPQKSTRCSYLSCISSSQRPSSWS
eukprot:TRINITY_DN5513_c1_g1_i4.p1 TRINITY_DN5513_c1_g1~~TRINITY_DN5513_c1_g1_i4.p1  ORF type:complete len:234 (-),score=7.94 TRINITY_DN5513_c1_g1_i4:51-752(-)